MAPQDPVHNLPLHPNSTAVDDSNFLKPAFNRLKQILLHNRLNLAWLKGMQVNGILNRDFMHRSRI